MSDYMKFLSPIRIEGRSAAWTSSIWSSVDSNELITKAGLQYYLNAEVAAKSTVSGGSDNASKYVKLDENGKLDTTVLPSLAITDTIVISDKTATSGVSAAINTALTGQSAAQIGDVVVFNPTLTQSEIEAGTYAVGSYIITGVTTSGDSTTYDTVRLTTAADGVLRINNKTGAYVELNVADLYAVNPSGADEGIKVTVTTSIAGTDANSESYKFPTAKAVVDFASNASNLTSGTVSNDRLNVATNSTLGIAAFDSNYFTVSSGVVTFGYAAQTTISDSDTNFPTSGAVVDYVANAANITSGTIDAARLPKATASTVGAAAFGSEFSISDAGVVSLAKSATTEITSSSDDTTTPTSGAVVDYVGSEITALSAKATVTGDGQSKKFTITHGLGSGDLFIQILDASNNLVFVPATISSTTVVIEFATAPTNGTTYKVLLYKVGGDAIDADNIEGDDPPGI